MRIRDLSGGEIRYLEIKLILNSKTSFIILDEPFNGLSPLLVETVVGWILEASKTKGVIIADHNIKAVHKVANRFMILHNCCLKEISNDKKSIIRNSTDIINIMKLLKH